ncbi:MAG: alpha-amylase family glycosyl hydrolase [Pirellula sp.]
MSAIPVENRVVGMGAIPHPSGVAFRVWAPHANAVFVMGSFNNWSIDTHAMLSEGSGYWFADISDAKLGSEYRFRIVNGDKVLIRIDPYARQVTSSVGNAIVVDPAFDWSGDNFQLKPVNELVIYELHLGTFFDKAQGDGKKFSEAATKLGYLKKLGVNVIEIMPLSQFAGYSSWGYNPSCVFAVETNYGGAIGLKQFVKEAHASGIGVVLDVVYNHFGPSDLDLWQFDGWSENDKGGIYFYNDWRAETPWGETRPDYGRPEVRQFIRDNAIMWLEDYHVDGLRLDMTLFIHNVHATNTPGDHLPDGWNLIQWINREVRSIYPGRITIAEDLRNDDRITRSTDEFGAGFTAQWDAQFVHPIRQSVIQSDDQYRYLDSIRIAMERRPNGDPFQRVIYSESHDENANGNSRVASEIDPLNPASWYAQKRSTLAAALVMTAPGIPMIFQGQEFLEDGWFQDTDPLDWNKSIEFCGLVQMYQDLITLRLNKSGTTKGLTGSGLNTFHQNQSENLIAFHRWNLSGPGDDVIVVVNLSHQARGDYRLGFPSSGIWNVRFNSDSESYGKSFANTNCHEVVAASVETGVKDTGSSSRRDGFPFEATIQIGPYSVLILSQDAV